MSSEIRSKTRRHTFKNCVIKKENNVAALFQRGLQIYFTNLLEVFLLNTTRNC